MGRSDRADGGGRRQRFLTKFRERFFLRFHMTLIMAAVVFSGVLASKIMWWFGVTSMAARYPMAVVCSYGVFFVLLSIWLLYIDAVHAGDQGATADLADTVGQLARGAIDANRRFSTGGDGVGDMVGSVADSVSSGGSDTGGGGGGGGSSFSLGDGDGEGGIIILAVLVVVMLVVFCSGVYVIWEAPNILAEVAFQAVLAGSLRRRAKMAEDPGWTGGVLRATWWPFAIVVLVSALFGGVAIGLCPGATRLPEVLNMCVPQLKH